MLTLTFIATLLNLVIFASLGMQSLIISRRRRNQRRIMHSIKIDDLDVSVKITGRTGDYTPRELAARLSDYFAAIVVSLDASGYGGSDADEDEERAVH